MTRPLTYDQQELHRRFCAVAAAQQAHRAAREKCRALRAAGLTPSPADAAACNETRRALDAAIRRYHEHGPCGREGGGRCA